MKIAKIASAGLTVFCLFMTIVCGFWLKTNEIAEQSSYGFHMTVGIMSAIFSITTLVLIIVENRRNAKK